MSDLPIISTEELEQRLERPTDDLHFWNVLTDEYFHGDMVPGSRRVPLGEVGREVSRLGLPKDAEIVVYCAGPSCPTSKQATQKLLSLGFTNVRAYEGGLEQWSEAGHELEKLEAEPVGA